MRDININKVNFVHLIEKPITKKLANYKEIGPFMERVFPKDELLPMWALCLLTKLKKFKFSAFYEDGFFVGIIFTIESKDTLFILYLAVNDKIHSKGYGSKLLQFLFEKYKNKSITLFIETMDSNAPNHEQRVKRLAFYERNGFVHTGITAGTNEPFVDILSTDKNFGLEQAKKLLRFTPFKIF